MPITYVCDRCHWTFSPKSKKPMFTPNTFNADHKYVIFRSDGDPNFIMCSNCLEELENWIDGRTPTLRDIPKDEEMEIISN